MVVLGVDTFLNVATVYVRGINPLAHFRSVASLWWIVVPIYVPLLTLFVYAYHTYSLELVLVFFVPTLAAQRLLQLYRQEKEATNRLETANDRLRRASLSFATALVATLDARDQYTAGHSAAVAIYAKDIARRMGLAEDQQELVHLCGLVHDIGKIGLPAGLLEKPGPLTLEERRQMEQHSEIGERILRNVDDYSEIADIVRSHHERIDGMGYPDGIHGDEIPLLARIIGVADAYDAMTSDRPYREALPESGRPHAPCAGCGDAVRHRRRRGVRGNPRHGRRELPLRPRIFVHARTRAACAGRGRRAVALDVIT